MYTTRVHQVFTRRITPMSIRIKLKGHCGVLFYSLSLKNYYATHISLIECNIYELLREELLYGRKQRRLYRKDYKGNY